MDTDKRLNKYYFIILLKIYKYIVMWNSEKYIMVL